MARRYDLEGAADIFKKQFANLMSAGKYDLAMEWAATAPKGVLRTLETINAFKQAGQNPITFFSVVLKKGPLNKVESLELVRPVVTSRNTQGLDKIKEFIAENKIECSEDLGDLLRGFNIQIALSVYLRAKVPEKVISCFLTLAAQETVEAQAMTHLNYIIDYSAQAKFTPDYPYLLSQLVRVNPNRAKDFALILMKHKDGSKVDISTVVPIFEQVNDVKDATFLILEYLQPRGDQPEDAALQTKVLEMNLRHTPKVAEYLIEQYKFTHYEKLKIAELAERAQSYQLALENFTDLADIKRVLSIATSALSPEFLLEYFRRLSPENGIECLRDLLKFNLAVNIRLVVEVAKKWNDYYTPSALIALFEEFKSYNGLYYYLGSFVASSTDSKVVFTYIEAATKLSRFQDVEQICRTHEHYDPKEVKEFLISQNLRDPRPLIHVCDRFGFVPELTHYLYSNNMYDFIAAYVQRMNPKATPAVFGELLELNAPEEKLKTLISTVRAPADDKEFVARLSASCEKYNRLKILRQWLENRVNEGSEDPHVHNALAKIYVDTNNNAQQFLTTNKFYDSRIVGAYCEVRDPHLAFIAYRRAWGDCDKELIEVTNKHGFFKDQARYLVERQHLELWALVLTDQNQYRRQLIDQVVATALPESRVPDEVSIAVKAFMAANLPNELIELLERIILHGSTDSEFHNNKNLQNLLILTAIKADPKRVMDYIKRLENYDGPEIAKIALSEQYKLFEEAFFIYKKFGKGEEAIAVLLDHLEDMDRAVEFAQYTDQAPVWSILAKAQLDNDKVKDAIASFLKADDASCLEDVVAAAKQHNLFAEVIPYLLMTRSKLQNPVVDNELIFAYAKTNKTVELEEFIAQPTRARIQEVADVIFEKEKLYNAARILYAHVNNNAKLAICLVKLGDYNAAVDSAKKANNINTWKEICFACVDAGHFRLASVCGVHVIVFLEHLVDIVRYYEQKGHFDELIALLEQGINLERAHQGIFTQLGVCYCKYRNEKVMEHIKLFHQKLNIPTLIGACQKNQLWNEAVFLYKNYDQFDNAIDVMIDHSPVAWEHKLFKEILLQVPNTEVFYKAIKFYLSEHPLLLNDLLMECSSKLDHTRVVTMFRERKHLPLIEKYLLHVQHNNLLSVNEAINELFFQEEKFKQLKESVTQYGNFDQIALAQKLESHGLLEFRRLATYLYKLNKRWEKSVELCKKDCLWADAMETIAESRSQDLAESLLYFFVEKGEKECFGAMLYTCYELIRPDIVLELAWRYQLTDYAMPFLIQAFRHVTERIQGLQQKLEDADKEKKQEEEKKKTDQPAADAHLNPVMALSLQHMHPASMMNPLALPPGPSSGFPALMPPPPNVPLQPTTTGLPFL